MEREQPVSESNIQSKPQSRLGPEFSMSDPITPFMTQRIQQQIRFSKVLTAADRHNCETSRKTQKEKQVTKRVQTLKHLTASQAIAIGAAFFSGPELNFSTPEPLEDSGGLDPVGGTPDIQQTFLPQGTAIIPTTTPRFVHGDLGFTDPIQRYRVLLAGTGTTPEVIDSFLDDQKWANENASAPTPIERHPGIRFCLNPPSEEDSLDDEATP